MSRFLDKLAVSEGDALQMLSQVESDLSEVYGMVESGSWATDNAYYQQLRKQIADNIMKSKDFMTHNGRS